MFVVYVSIYDYACHMKTSGKDLTAPPLTKPKSSPTKSLGKGWFGLQPAEMTDQLKADLKMVGSLVIKIIY